MRAIDLAPSRFEIGTRRAFGLVDPVFQEACRRYIAMFVAYIMRLVHALGQLQIAFPEFGQHVVELDEIGIIIGHQLQLRDANGSSWLSDKEQHVSQQHRRGIADGVPAIDRKSVV